MASEDGNHLHGAVYGQAVHVLDKEAISEFRREKSSLFCVRMGYPLGKYMAAVVSRICDSQKLTNAFEDLLC